MFETLDRMMLAGLGAVSMTRERAEKLFDEYVVRGTLEKETKSGFVKEMLDSAERTRTELARIVSEQVTKALEDMNLPTRDDLKRVEEKIDKVCGPES